MEEVPHSGNRHRAKVANPTGCAGIGHTKAYELVTRPGGIPNVRIGRAIRINRRDLADWLDRQKCQNVND